MFAIPDFLREINLLSLVLRFMLAILFGGLIGYGRSKGRHPAGLRTHLVVCIGSASVMMVSQYIYGLTGDGDLARMGAQVISGIGFLGAGSIIVTGKSQVTGLTTAAGLWTTACMGLAIGIGFYECAAVMCLLLYFVLVTLNKLDENYLKSKIITVYVELAEGTALSALLTVVRERGFQIDSLEKFSDAPDKGAYKICISAKGADFTHEHVLGLLHASPSVFFADVL